MAVSIKIKTRTELAILAANNAIGVRVVKVQRLWFGHVISADGKDMIEPLEFASRPEAIKGTMDRAYTILTPDGRRPHKIFLP